MSEPSKGPRFRPKDQSKKKDAAEPDEAAEEDSPEENPEPPPNRYGYDKHQWPESR
jgi:hypothetical protein